MHTTAYKALQIYAQIKIKAQSALNRLYPDLRQLREAQDVGNWNPFLNVTAILQSCQHTAIHVRSSQLTLL